MGVVGSHLDIVPVQGGPPVDIARGLTTPVFAIEVHFSSTLAVKGSSPRKPGTYVYGDSTQLTHPPQGSRPHRPGGEAEFSAFWVRLCPSTSQLVRAPKANL